MEKMFVRYSKTKAQFIAENLESKYNNSIVFIGDGECVYTHGKYFGSLEDAVAEIGDLKSEVSNLKYFSAIKAGDVTATAAGKDGVITFNASDPSTVSVSAGSHGVTIGLTSDFVNKVNTAATQAGAAATQAALNQEIQRAQNAEGTLQLAINSNSGDISDLKTKVGNDTVSNQIEAKITALNLENTYATKAEVEEEFKGYFTDTEVENMLQSLEERLQDNIDAKADQDHVDSKFQDIDGALEDLNGDLEDHINDSDVHVTAELQSKWNNAAENIAAFLDENAVSDNVVNTLKEIQEYITSDGAAADLMTQNIAKAQNAADKAQGEVDALEGVVASNLAEAKKYADDAVAALDVTDAAVAGEYVSAVSETDGKISVTRAKLPVYTLTKGNESRGQYVHVIPTVSQKPDGAENDWVVGVTVNDQILANTFDFIETRLNNVYEKTEVDGLLDAKANSADVYNKTEVDTMWTWEEL